MSIIIDSFNALPTDLRAKFSKIKEPEPDLVYFMIADDVPCVRKLRYITWVGGLRLSLSCGIEELSCDPADPECVEWAFRHALRQLETGRRFPNNPEDPIVTAFNSLPADFRAIFTCLESDDCSRWYFYVAEDFYTLNGSPVCIRWNDGSWPYLESKFGDIDCVPHIQNSVELALRTALLEFMTGRKEHPSEIKLEEKFPTTSLTMKSYIEELVKERREKYKLYEQEYMEEQREKYKLYEQACMHYVVEAKKTFYYSQDIDAMGDKIIFPDEIVYWVIKMKMPVGNRTLHVFFCISPSKMLGQINCDKNCPLIPHPPMQHYQDLGDNFSIPLPIMEIGLVNINDFPDLVRHRGYRGQLRSFKWDAASWDDYSGGFAKIIEELVHLRKVLDRLPAFHYPYPPEYYDECYDDNELNWDDYDSDFDEYCGAETEENGETDIDEED